MLSWCPVIHWWSLVSLWPARLPAGASAEHQSALTTTPALYLWSLPPLVHCGKTRGLELEKWIYSLFLYLNKFKNACLQFYECSIKIIHFENVNIFCMFSVFLLCTALLALHLNIPPPPPTWYNFLPNIPNHHLSTLCSLVSSLPPGTNNPSLPIIT